MVEESILQKFRLQFKPALPEILQDVNTAVLKQRAEGGKKPDELLRKLFPRTFDRAPFVLERGTGIKRALKIGAIFSGGQASGGHNVLAGLFRAIQEIDSSSKLYGFLDGPSGVLSNKKRELSDQEIGSYFNQGGFDLIGTGRTKIETEEQLAASLQACQNSDLDGLVVIGGDDSNTNAAFLAEYFLQKGCKISVVGVPKTIDGDLRSRDIELSFGFDSACKTYSEIIGNISRDARSAKKYYHFIKLMGRSASHITLECALATHPNLAFIGEEKKSLKEIVNEIVDLIIKRSESGKNYGVILIPEGLIEFIPELQVLIASLNRWLVENPENPNRVIEKLTEEEKVLFSMLGEKIQSQLLLDRDPHGNVMLSQIETEVLLMDLVKRELKKRSSYKGKFSAQNHFLGYEGRSCFPSNFDANYAYSLGVLAALAVRDGATGTISAIGHLKEAPSLWQPKMVPILQLMHLEMRGGKEKPVIRKAVVDLKSKSFLDFSAQKESWKIEDAYRYPGPIQFFGDPALTDAPPITLT